jgi:hypothetical protein
MRKDSDSGLPPSWFPAFQSKEEADAAWADVTVGARRGLTLKQILRLREDFYACYFCRKWVLLSYARGSGTLDPFIKWDDDLTYSDAWDMHPCSRQRGFLSVDAQKIALTLEYNHGFNQAWHLEQGTYRNETDSGYRRPCWEGRCGDCRKRVFYLGGEHRPPPFEIPGPGHIPERDPLIKHLCNGRQVPRKTRKSWHD